MKKTKSELPNFIKDKRGIAIFLVTVLMFAILFIVIYHPAGYMRTGEALSRWNKYLYTTIQVFTGFLILTASRIVFYHVEKRHRFTKRDALLWIVGEIIIISLILTGIALLLNADENLEFPELIRRVFINVVSILFIPYVLTVLIMMLRDRRQQIDELNELIDKHLEEKIDTGDNLNFYDRGGKLAFSTKRSNVLYIEAADNYSNIHYLNEGKEDTFILHNSLKQLDDSDKYKGLLRCHRGYMVNIDNVKLLRKEKDGLVIELSQGARSIPVSRTYNHHVVAFFAGDNN